MKVRYIKTYGNRLYIKEVKRNWWGKWEMERAEDGLPYLYQEGRHGEKSKYISE